jgi:hypothetical protein
VLNRRFISDWSELSSRRGSQRTMVIKDPPGVGSTSLPQYET